MRLTAAERETVIIFNDEDEVALVQSAQRPVISKLRRNPAARLVEEGRVGSSVWAVFEIPKSLVSFRSKERRFSEAERARRASQLARIAESHVTGESSDSSRGISAAAREVGE
jgi:hypothetical protein